MHHRDTNNNCFNVLVAHVLLSTGAEQSIALAPLRCDASTAVWILSRIVLTSKALVREMLSTLALESYSERVVLLRYSRRSIEDFNLVKKRSPASSPAYRANNKHVQPCTACASMEFRAGVSSFSVATSPTVAWSHMGVEHAGIPGC